MKNVRLYFVQMYIHAYLFEQTQSFIWEKKKVRGIETETKLGEISLVSFLSSDCHSMRGSLILEGNFVSGSVFNSCVFRLISRIAISRLNRTKPHL
jgi:hypothetical protein